MNALIQNIQNQIEDLDKTGFFIRNGTYGLEKRDNLLADLRKLEEEIDGLTQPNIIKVILDDHGCMGSSDLARLAKEFPFCKVIIKWERSPRSSHHAADAVCVIKSAEENPIEGLRDYVREVFVSADNLDKLKGVLE